MAKFVDSNGGEWVLRLKLGHRKPLADLGIGFDATNFGRTIASFLAICDDPDKVAKVAHLIAVSPPSPPEQLADSFDGEGFATASLALADEVIDFFHHGRPATAEAARAAVKAVLTQQDQTTATELTRSVSVTSSPDSPASTPPT